ncbi:MAG: aminoglycoside 6-adenylyltransferase [Anaerolineae bacterium]
MRSEREVLHQLQRWGEARPNVRVMILTSSRANPYRSPDRLSDYDVEVFVRNAAPFVQNDAWVREFGEIMVRWPSTPQPTADEAWVTQLVLYEDGTRIDFQVTALPPDASDNLGNGYQILLDKDGTADALPEPTYSQHLIQPPTAEAFDSRMNAFWWDIVYVAKALRRGELNYARRMLDGTIRYDKLQPLIEWYIAMNHEEPVNTGIYGRWFHEYLDPDTWADYERTFAGADFEDHWRALFATLDLVRKLGRALAREHGFDYPEETDRKVTAYMQWIRELDHLTDHVQNGGTEP